MVDAAPRACSRCGCTDAAPCSGGCGWLPMGTLCSACFEEGHLGFDLPLIVVLALHGHLCLALRHPENTGGSRTLIEELVEDLEAQLVAIGALTPAEVTDIHRVEAAAAPRIVLGRG